MASNISVPIRLLPFLSVSLAACGCLKILGIKAIPLELAVAMSQIKVIADLDVAIPKVRWPDGCVTFIRNDEKQHTVLKAYSNSANGEIFINGHASHKFIYSDLHDVLEFKSQLLKHTSESTLIEELASSKTGDGKTVRNYKVDCDGEIRTESYIDGVIDQLQYDGKLVVKFQHGHNQAWTIETSYVIAEGTTNTTGEIKQFKSWLPGFKHVLPEFFVEEAFLTLSKDIGYNEDVIAKIKALQPA